jgi:hypothetical protein
LKKKKKKKEFRVVFCRFTICYSFIYCFSPLPVVLYIQSTTRDLELAPKPSGSGGSVGSGSRGSNTDLGAFSNGSTGGADSPTQSGGAAAASSAPPAHPSRDILEEVLSKSGPYPMVRKKQKNKTKTNYFLKGNFILLYFKSEKKS